MKYLRSVRGRMLCIAFIPGACLFIVAAVIAVFLVHQAIRTQEMAEDTAAAADRVTRYVVALQGQRSQAMVVPEHRATAYASFTQRIDTSIASLRDLARLAPDAESAFQQMTAVQLLTIAEGMYGADSLAVAGLDTVTRRPFTAAVGSYRTGLEQVSTQLTESGRVAYESLTRGADWSRLAAAEDALAAAEPMPIVESTWRLAAYEVARQLGTLYTQQSQYAVQLTLDAGRRTLAGALAASVAIMLFAALVMIVVRRLIARVPMPVVPIMLRAGGSMIPRPRHAASPRAAMPDPRLMKAVLDGLRRM